MGDRLPPPQAHVVHNCRRLSVEFMNYIAVSRSLRKVPVCVCDVCMVYACVCVCDVCVCMCVMCVCVCDVCIHAISYAHVQVWHVETQCTI